MRINIRSNRPAQPGPRNPERGAAMMVITTLLIALLAAGGVALYIQLQSTKASGVVKETKASLFCAEAGLSATIDIIAANAADWDLVLNGVDGDDPAWYVDADVSLDPGIYGDIDGDGEYDWHVTIEDNDDEAPVSDRTTNTDTSVFVLSECIKYPNSPRIVAQLAEFAGAGTVYDAQKGQGQTRGGNVN